MKRVKEVGSLEGRKRASEVEERATKAGGEGQIRTPPSHRELGQAIVKQIRVDIAAAEQDRAE